MNKELKKLVGRVGKYAIATANASIEGNRAKADKQVENLSLAIEAVKICREKSHANHDQSN